MNMQTSTATSKSTLNTLSSGYFSVGKVTRCYSYREQMFVDIKNIEILDEKKVVKVTFTNGIEVKTECHKSDIFDLRRALFIAIAKYMYSELYTMKGIEKIADDLECHKSAIKVVEAGIKLYNDKIKKNKAEQAKRRREKEKKIRDMAYEQQKIAEYQNSWSKKQNNK